MKQKSKHKRRDGLERQAQIMAIGLKLFSEKGYNATSIDDIISTAGIAKRTFYLHFDSKKELLNRIIDVYFKILSDYLKVLDLSEQIPAEDIKKFFIDIVEYLTNMPEMKQFGKLILRDIIGLGEDLLNRFNDFQNDIIKMLVEYHGKAQKEGRILPETDPVIISLILVGASKEILFRWLVLEENIDIKKAIISSVDIYYRASYNYTAK